MKSSLLAISLAGSLAIATVITGQSVSAAGGTDDSESSCDADYVTERNGVRTVAPNGTDDTDNLECAINEAGQHWRKTVRLTEGTFHSDFLTIEGYQGKIEGAGRDLTTIEPLAGGLDCTPVFEDIDFVPWLAFEGSNPTLTDFALSIPDVACSEPYLEITDIDPDTGEILFQGSFQDFNAMVVSVSRFPGPSTDCGITVDAGLTVKRVDVDAPPPDFSAPIFNPQGAFSAFYAGGILIDECLGVADRISGGVTVTDVDSDGAGNLITAFLMTDAPVRVTNNHVTNVDDAVVVGASARSIASVHSNLFEGVTDIGVLTFNCIGFGPDAADETCIDEPTRVSVHDNDIEVSPIGTAGVIAADGNTVDPRMDLNVRRNNISGAGNIAGVILDGIDDARIRQNTFTGASVFGVLADGPTMRSRIVANDMTGHTAFVAGVLLEVDTSWNTVRRNAGATVVDLGTDNNVVAEISAITTAKASATATTRTAHPGAIEQVTTDRFVRPASSGNWPSW